MVAAAVSLKQWRSQQAGDLRLWRRPYNARTNRQIHLRKARGATASRSTFSAQADENRLCAGRRNPRRSRACEASNASDSTGNAGACIRIKNVNTLRTEIGDQKLRPIRRHRQTAQTCVGRRPARRLQRRNKRAKLQVEDLYMIDVREINPLTALIVCQKTEKARLGIGLRAGQILE